MTRKKKIVRAVKICTIGNKYTKPEPKTKATKDK